ncbi:wax ester synthase/diacylglycerol acyltransferase 11-like [Capsicum galapagoense]
MEGDGKKMTLKPIRIISKNIDENGGGEEAILLSPITRMFHEPGYKFYILAIMGWKVPIDVDSIKAELQRKMLKHPRFSSLQVMDKLSQDGNGEMRWVPTTVNIDDHIILPQIAHNNMDDADKLVEQYISNLSTTTIDMSKPLWDFHVLNMKTSRAEATCIFRFHHSLGDGVALISFLLSCFRTTSDPTSLPTIPVSSSKDKSNLSISNSRNKILSLLWKYLVKLWLFIKLLFNTIIDLFLITFGSRAATTFVGKVVSQTTLIFSNVAGPLEQVSLAGHPLTFLAPTCSGHLTVIMPSAQLTFVVAVDEGLLIPDPSQLGDDFVDSFMLIKEAALTKLRTNTDV